MILLPLLLLATGGQASPRIQDSQLDRANSLLPSEGPGGAHTQLIIRPRQECSSRLYFVVLVHSAPDNFRERDLVRETWGSLSSLQGWQVRVVFLLGLAGGQEGRTHHRQNSLKSRSLHTGAFLKSSSRRFHRHDSVNQLVKLESYRHGDIVQGNFTDSPANLTTKHVMGYRWVEEHCNTPRFVLKTDDDVFVEMYHLFNFVNAVYGSKPGPSLVCDVIPAGTSPQRSGKWALPDKQFKRFYPKYCSGAAYLITPSLVSSFLRASGSVPALWRDDVYMTGLVRDSLGVAPFYLNLRYTYEQTRARKWLRSKKRSPLPFIFIVSTSEGDTRKLSTGEGDRSWPALVRALWSKTKDLQSDYPV